MIKRTPTSPCPWPFMLARMKTCKSLALGAALVGAASWTLAADRLEFSDLQLIAEDVDKPTSIRVVDVDADGDHDILVASANDSTIRLYKNNGMDAVEQFSETILGTNVSGANWVCGGDLDGDGDFDVLAAGRFSDSVVWFEQRHMHSGTFRSAQDITSSLDGASYASAGDMDGDGDMDVVATGYNADELVWYENMGDWNWSSANVIDGTRDGPWSAMISDMDGDGDMDVTAAFYAEDEVAWFMNDGAGMFDAGTTLVADADGAAGLGAADLDHDGDHDLMFVSYRDDTFGWLENMGDGYYSDPMHVDVVLDGPAAIATADFDRDGDMDVAVNSLRDDRIVAFESRSDGLGDPIEVSDGEADLPRVIAAADVDDDGNWDIAVGASNDDIVGWFENLSELPRVLTPPTAAPTNVTGSYGVESISMRWDSVPSSENGGTSIIRYVATASPTTEEGPTGRCIVPATTNRCRVLGLTAEIEYSATVRAENLSGAGPESDPPVTAVPVLPSGEAAELSDEMVIDDNSDSVTSIHVADLDGDMDMDVMASSVGDSTVSWHENMGNDTFSDRQVLSDMVPKSYSVRAGDLDNDGDMDVLASSRGGDELVWFANNGDGSFGEKQTLLGDVEGASFAMAADIDGDADHDVVYAAYEGDYVAWIENMGDGAWSDPNMVTTDIDGPWNLAAGDMNGDGKLDLVSASIKDDMIAWYLNEGGGDYTQYVLTTMANSAASVHVADLDGDADLDIVQGSYADDTVSWFENQGMNNFSDEMMITTLTDGVASVSAGDVDLDGDIDVFSASIRDDTVAWHENLGDSTFGEMHVISSHSDGARAVAVSDAEDDGDNDVFAGTFYENSVSWWKNLSPLPPPFVIVDPDEGGPPETAPMNVQLTIGVETITVTWDPLTPSDEIPIDRYVVQVTGSDGSITTCTVEHPMNSCTFDQLSSDIEYSVVVWAENQYGTGPESMPVTGTPLPQVYGIVGKIFVEGNYELDSDTQDPNNVSQSNDTLAEAQSIQFPSRVTGWIDGSGNQGPYDWFEVDLPPGEKEITLYMADGCPIDLDIFFYDADGILLASPFLGCNSHETVTTDDEGTHYIRISSWTSWTVGVGYMFSVDMAGGAAAQLPGSAVLGDYPLNPGEAIVKLAPESGEESHKETVERLAADGHFQMLAGSPDREFLVEMAMDQLNGTEVTIDGRTERFRTEEDAERFLTRYLIKKLESLDEVEVAFANGRVEFLAEPDDPDYDDQWHYPNIGLEEAWDIATGSEDVLMGFVDSGYTDHPDLIDRLEERSDGSIAGYDFVRNTALSEDGDGIDPDAFDSSYIAHGTFVAGIMGAETDNDDFGAGVTWAGTMMPVRIFEVYDIIQGLRYVAGMDNDSGTVPDRLPSVVNVSLGQAPRWECRLRSHDPVWDEIHSVGFENGVLFVWASGNDGCGNLGPWKLHEYAINVGATNQGGTRVGFSSYGEDLFMMAPGQNVFSISTTGTGSPTFGSSSGTSFSAPHVVGVMGLMLGTNDNLTVYDVFHLLRGTHPEWDDGPVTDDMGAPGFDWLTGYGQINAEKAVDAANSITGGLPMIEEPRLRLPYKSWVFMSGESQKQVPWVNAGFGGDPLQVTGFSSTEPWVTGVSHEGDELLLTIDRSLIPNPSYGGQRRSIVTLHSNGGSESLTVFALVGDTSENGDIGTVYVSLIPVSEGTTNPVLQATLDTSAGETEFVFENIPYDDYIAIAATDKADFGRNCSLQVGEMCGTFPDAYEAAQGFGLFIINLDGPATPVEMYMYYLGWNIDAVWRSNDVVDLARQRIQEAEDQEQ